jgi:starch synthase (maltosyl-transferring)
VSFRDNGRYYYTIIAWRDLFSSWREEITKKHGAGLSVELELEEGRSLEALSRSSEYQFSSERKARGRLDRSVAVRPGATFRP